MDRTAIRARIDALECLTDVQEALDDLQGVEFAPSEDGAFDLNITTTSNGKQAVTFINHVSPFVLAVGLQAMQRELARIGGVVEVEA